MEKEPTVFVVDDDPAARDSVAALVQSKGMAASTYASAEEFLQRFDPSQAGCVVVDVRMNGMSGLELQRKFRAQETHLPVIMISGYADTPSAVDAMRNGAVTFLEKPYRDKELWESILTALDRYHEDQEAKTRRAELRARLARLTPQEHEVLEKLVAGKPNKAIKAEMDIGLRTVELRRANVMKKMEAGSLAELVRLYVQLQEDSEGAA